MTSGTDSAARWVPKLLVAAFVAAAGIVAAALIAGPPPGPAEPVVFTALAEPGDGTATVLFVGPSITTEVLAAASAALDTLGWAEIIDGTVGGVPDFSDDLLYDWRSEWAALLDEHDPDTVVVFANFAQPKVECVGMHEQQLQCLKDAPPVWFTPQAVEMVDVLSSTGASVAWIGYPVSEDASDDDGYIHTPYMNQVLGGILDRLPAAAFVDPTGPLGGPGYQQWLPVDDGQWRQARKPDRIHLCPHGAALVADTLLETIIAGWTADPDAAWIDGDWRNHPVYDDGDVARYGPMCDDNAYDEPPRR